jgi:hypothetical protein
MRKGQRLPLPPSGISVWTPLSSSGSGLIAILGAGATEGLAASAEDVPCVWCGLRSPRAAACEICGSPLYESFSVWQPVPSIHEEPAARSRMELELELEPPAPSSGRSEPSKESGPARFRRFAGLEIRWIRLPSD